MSQSGVIMEQMRAGLQSGLTHRLVVRELKDFSDRDEQELRKGVYSFVSKGISEDSIYKRYVDFILVGQIKTEDDAGGLAIEEAELTMIDEVMAFQAAMRLNIPLDRIIQSRQLDAPYGWISVESKVGPFDFNCPDISGLADFILFHAESNFGGTADDPVMISEETLAQ